MPNGRLLLVLSVLPLLLSSMGSASEPPAYSQIELPNAIHFAAPDGTDLPVPPGTYLLTSSDTAHLLLTPFMSGPALVVRATATIHAETIGSPTALLVVTSEDDSHLLLLLPDHTALQAQGNRSGVRSRGDISRRSPVSAATISQMMTLRPLVAGAPAPPIPISPSAGTIFTHPALRFQWQMGPDQPAPVRYEVCVREANQSCPGPTAVIFKSVGVPLREPLLQPQAGLGPPPGSPGFQPPSGTPGPPPYFHHAVLPFQLQGRQLHWSVMTCVPYTAPGTISRLGQQETCITSEPKPITWMLPAPTLTSPLDNTVLPTTTMNLVQSLSQPSFAWNYPNQEGVDHFLVCIVKAGTPCPSQPGIQPNTLVARVRGATTFALPHDLSPFMGQTLHWTVTACSTVVGCSSQPPPRRLQVPATVGSFDAIFQVTQHPKCLNCHQMHRGNDNYLRHIQLGRFTGQEIPPASVPGASKCKGCHTATTGFTDSWRAPGPDFSFERSIFDVCRNIQSRFGLGLSTSTEEHLGLDANILWAVDRIPGLDRSEWNKRTYAWSSRTNRTCPCDPRDTYCKTPYGQFTR